MPKIIAPSDSPLHTHRIVALMHAGFLLVGIANTLLGPILPLLSSRWQLSDAQAGHLFIAQFAGAIAGSALSGWLIRKLGSMSVLAAGYGGLAAATAALAFSPRQAGIAAIATLGFSLGLTNPATNLLVSELNPERRAAALNLLNLIWGLGAILCPLLISLLTRQSHSLRSLLAIAALLAIMALLLARHSSHTIAHTPGIHSGQAIESQSVLRAWLSPYALLTGALVFVYVGTETAVSGWIAAYVQRLGATAQTFWALASSLFWAGLLSGRAAAPAILRRITEEKLVIFSLIIALCGMSVILLGQGFVSASIGAGLTGFGLATIFPTTFAVFTQRFGALASQMAGVIFILASLGGAILPWFVGFISSGSGELRLGLFVPLFGVIVMLALQITIVMQERIRNKRKIREVSSSG
ncbi:MAG: MFS transporter [Acidobacteria bacterium]|nr:MFS transporter [Acidobacteriota bacterium]